MFKFLKGKAKKIATGLGMALVTATTLAVGVCAEGEEVTTSTNLGSYVSTAGTTLQEQFGALVAALVPTLTAIAVVGLGLYACIYLFKMAKKFFSMAAK